MQTLHRSCGFKSDYNRVKFITKHRNQVEISLMDVLGHPISDRALPEHYRDHSLSGNWDGYRECHLKPDLLRIYDKPGKSILRLVRLGSHSELFE